jgi:gliding motility-associated-like protein
VLDYPRFHSNEDSINDLWTIKNLDLFPQATITIFNRYGKLLKEMSPTSMGWNGTFNGSNYRPQWFNLTFEDGKNHKGHFSLKITYILLCLPYENNTTSLHLYQ